MKDSESFDESFPQSWDQLVDEFGETKKKTKRKKYKVKDESSNHLRDSKQRWKWMVEPKYKQMFDEIEQKIQGAIGVGKFEWVDRRVFDQVFDKYKN